MANHKFCQFDYGSEKNLQVYGTPQPSDYKLELVSVPVAIYVGKNDRFSTVEVNTYIIILIAVQLK